MSNGKTLLHGRNHRYHKQRDYYVGSKGGLWHKRRDNIVLPRWRPITDELLLKPITSVLYQSYQDGYWYHSSVSNSDEVRGPYRTRKDAKIAYDIELDDITRLRAEVYKATGGE